MEQTNRLNLLKELCAIDGVSGCEGKLLSGSNLTFLLTAPHIQTQEETSSARKKENRLLKTS